MRSFDERKAEIFRRGNERIKKRKRNKTVIFSLLPIFFCAIIWSVAAGNMEKSNYMGDSVLPENYYDEECVPIPDQYTQLEISEKATENGFYKKVEAIAEIEAVSGIIDGIIESANADKAPNNSKLESETQVNDATKKNTYELKFTFVNGDCKSFTLVGNELISGDGKNVYRISDSQLNELIDLLDITK